MLSDRFVFLLSGEGRVVPESTISLMIQFRSDVSNGENEASDIAQEAVRCHFLISSILV